MCIVHSSSIPLCISTERKDPLHLLINGVVMHWKNKVIHGPGNNELQEFHRERNVERKKINHTKFKSQRPRAVLKQVRNFLLFTEDPHTI